MAIRGAGGGGGGSGCFPAYTLVSVPGGQQRIDSLEPGDIVLSFNDQGTLIPAQVVKLHIHDDQPVNRYHLWGGTHIDATPNHWVLNQFNAFVCIDTLGPDDCLVDGLGHLRPILRKEALERTTVFNLTVEGQHTFIADNIRVHNAGLGATIAGAGGGGGGGKGGGGSQRVPTEADDSLQSVQYGTVIDLLSEGEIQGLDSSLKSVYLDGTPLFGPSGTANFSGYTGEFRSGTQNQTYISQATGIESETGVNVEITNATSVTRTITDTDVDRVRVTLQIPALQIIEDDGDIIGHSVSVQIQVQYNGGGFTTAISDTISGKTTTAYQRDYIIPLTGAFPVDIKFVRTSVDESSARRQNRTFWFSYTEILDEKLRYPNSALAYLRFDSRQFDNIPTRKYLIRGIKVRLPSNATVDTTTYLGRVTYAGVWDGTFGAATWCADPAWCLWDLLTSTRYGASIPEASLDRYDFYAISQYCNELVSNGFGGLEPRFLCHVLLNNREEVFTLIQEFVSIFRGIAYYGAGSMVVLADKPSDPQYILGPANVLDGNFSYSGSSQKARHTTATVAYQTYESLGEVEFEYVEDSSAVAKYGVINKDIRAFGCYSRGQAHRLGKWALLTEQNLTETVSFSVSIDSGIVLRPGMVVGIADPVKSGSRRSGRISSATTTAITVDSTTGLPTTTANAPTISVLLPTGLVETRSISSIAGSVFTLSSALSEAPNAESVFLIETNDIRSNLFRVISVAEGENGAFTVTALTYNQSLYAAIEADLKLEFRDISNLSAIPDAPNSISAVEHLYVDGQNVLTAVELSWISPVQRVAGFRVEYRLDNNNWIQLETTSPSVRLTGLKAGTLYVQIRSLNSLNKLSPAAVGQFNLVGKTAPPTTLTGLYANVIDPQTVELAWDLHPDLDVRVGGKILIRHTPRTSGAEWANATTIVPAVSGGQTRKIVPFVVGTYLLLPQDDLGNTAATPTLIVLDAQSRPQPTFVVRTGTSPVGEPDLTFAEDLTTPPFQGNLTDMLYSVDQDGLILANGVDWDSLPGLVDEYPAIDAAGGVAASGEYEFGSTLDLGAVYEVNLRGRFVTRAFNPGNLWDDLPNIDLLVSIDDVIGNPDAELQFRYSQDASTYSNWIPYQANLVRGRAFQFKVTATSGDERENIIIEELGVTVLLQQQSQTDGPITSGATTYTVTFTNAFYQAPQISITALNMTTGDYVDITSITRTGFQVTFRNSSGTAVSRNFHYLATGYGKEFI